MHVDSFSPSFSSRRSQTHTPSLPSAQSASFSLCVTFTSTPKHVNTDYTSSNCTHHTDTLLSSNLSVSQRRPPDSSPEYCKQQTVVQTAAARPSRRSSHHTDIQTHTVYCVRPSFALPLTHARTHASHIPWSPLTLLAPPHPNQ